ncbi:GroES-like protein [Periconia macrospinosa]|uniref:GroES-like protein n=1 Tax=Periconia macrospinosa TaxID=97972 RepID=A0A2V1DZ67_9PLEO|nr:GroES-like protein [Periconia macrospinosa]
MSTSIRKAYIPSFGDESHVTVMTAPIEPPSAKEVQIKVLYSGFGGSDITMRMGKYPNMKDAPLTPGYCLVGRVRALGASCTKFKKNDLVVAMTKYDSQAQLTNFEEKFVVKCPEGIDYEQAVAMVLDWSTAYGMTHRGAKIEKGARVFIHGLSGAVGFAAFTFCKMQGAEVYGTASLSKHERLEQYGVTEAFVYTDKNWMTAMKNLGGAHVVFDALGFESWDESYDILCPKGGHLVGLGGNYDVLNGSEPRNQYVAIAKLLAKGMVPFCPFKTSFYYIDKEQKTFEPELKELLQMSVEGKIHAPIKKRLTLEEIPQAHREFHKYKDIGSVVVKVADDDGTGDL